MLNHESTLLMPDDAITLSFYHAMVGAELVFARHTKTTDFHIIICGQRQVTMFAEANAVHPHPME